VVQLVRLEDFRAWLHANPAVFSFAGVFAITQPELFLLTTSRLMGKEELAAPIPGDVQAHFHKIGLVSLLVENIPQIVVQILASLTLGITFVGTLSFILSIATLVQGLLSRVVIVWAATHTETLEMQTRVAAITLDGDSQ